MTGIFVANMSNEDERLAFEGTATRPLDRQTVLASFNDLTQSELEAIEHEAQGFFAWHATLPEAANDGAAMRRDDLVLVNYQGIYRHFARVLGACKDPAAATSLWGDGAARDHILFLSKPVPIEVPASALDDYMLTPGEGLQAIGAPICDRIETDYGNLERFARLRLLSRGAQLKNISVSRTTIGAEIEAAQAELLTNIERRRGQPQLRELLLDAYQQRCAITGSAAECNLEVAYIIPERGDLTHSPCNALLLRADIHNLFDLGKLAIDTRTLTVRISHEIIGSTYRILQGRPVQLPTGNELRPDLFALDMHRRLAHL
jgi:hypothetical protein